MLRGFIDESHDGGKPPKIFELSCLITSDAGCVYFDLDWQDLVEKKNEELRKQGRKAISRFHAAPFNNYRGEFEGWTPDEQEDFSHGVLRALLDERQGTEPVVFQLKEPVGVVECFSTALKRHGLKGKHSMTE